MALAPDALWESMVTVGRVIRPQGNRGEVVVASETDWGAERFQPGAAVYAMRSGQLDRLTVAASRPHQGRWVVGLAGVATITDAEALRGLDLKIPAGELRALGPGEYYLHDLVGCAVQTTASRVVGTVERVDLGPGAPMLVVAGPAGEVLVPLVEAICRSVDVAAKMIVITPLDGLVELNAPTRRGTGTTRS
jgi:16S rRNA processing protein RimM